MRYNPSRRVANTQPHRILTVYWAPTWLNPTGTRSETSADIYPNQKAAWAAIRAATADVMQVKYRVPVAAS